MKENFTRFVRFNTNQGRMSGIFVGFKPKGKIVVKLKTGKLIERDCFKHKVEIYKPGVVFADFTGKRDPILRKICERR